MIMVLLYDTNTKIKNIMFLNHKVEVIACLYVFSRFSVFYLKTESVICVVSF